MWLKKKKVFYVHVIFWASRLYWLLFSSLSLPSGGPDTHFCFTWDCRVTAWFQELKHWEKHQTVRADHTGWAGSTKFRSFKILHLYSAARLLTEVKKNLKHFVSFKLIASF